jgi:hypothetical protein
MTAALTTAAVVPVPPAVPLTTLNKPCHTATTAMLRVRSYIQPSTTEPATRPSNQPTVVATPKSWNAASTRNIGRCQPAQTSASTSVAGSGRSRRCSAGSANPRHPVSSPNPLTSTSTAATSTGPPTDGRPDMTPKSG